MSWATREDLMAGRRITPGSNDTVRARDARAELYGWSPEYLAAMQEYERKVAKGSKACAREFTNAAGELIKIIVDVTRSTDGGPVVVSSKNAMPMGKHFRFGQHVELLDVWRAADDWLVSLPEDYCLDISCSDLRAHEWSRFIRDYLSKVPCVAVPAKDSE